MLYTILPWRKLVLLCMTMFLLCGCKASFTPLFEYDKNNCFLFDDGGNIIKLSDYIPPVNPSSKIKTEISDRGEYMVTWKDFSCRGNPGDRIFPVYENGNCLYLLTEKDSDYMQLLIWDRKRKNGHVLVKGHSKRLPHLAIRPIRHLNRFKPPFETFA